jgi:pentatricopeptide repeat protein
MTAMRSHGIDSLTTIVGMVHDALHLELERHVPLPPLPSNFMEREQLVSDAETSYYNVAPPLLPRHIPEEEHIIYASLIAAYARDSNGAAIMSTLLDMRLQSIQPSNDCYAAAMAHFARLGEFERVLKLYNDMTTLKVPTSSITDALRIRAMAGSGNIDGMMTIMKQPGSSSLLSYKGAMISLATSGDIPRLEELLSQACAASTRTVQPLQLDRDIFQMVFHGYARKGTASRAGACL